MADEDVKSEEKKTEDAKVNGEKKETSPLTIKLRKSIIANGDETDTLQFREPTAADIEYCGNPVNLTDMGPTEQPRVTFDAKAMTVMMARLATVPPSAIRQLHTKDWNTAAWALAGFFVPDM